MKKIIVSIVFIFSIQFVYSQVDIQEPPLGYKCDSCLWGCPMPITSIVKDSKVIFEGLVLTDSSFCDAFGPCIYHRILLLKQFKGVFKSDTLELVNATNGISCNHPAIVRCAPNIHKGVKGIFCAGIYYNIFSVIGPCDGCGFVEICDKKDVIKEVYEPIEAATGQPYVEVHPNTCATLKKK